MRGAVDVVLAVMLTGVLASLGWYVRRIIAKLDNAQAERAADGAALISRLVTNQEELTRLYAAMNGRIGRIEGILQRSSL
jgi:hypothetical protein